MDYAKSGTGPPLLYIPGIDGTGELFFQQEAALADRFTILRSRLRQDTPFDYGNLVADAVSVLDCEGIEKATVVAESFGGSVALHFALQHPDRVQTLVLVNTFSYLRIRKLLRLGQLLLPLAFNGPARWGRNFIMRPLLASEKVDRESAERMLKASWSHTYSAYRQRLRLLAEYDLRNRLSEVSARTIIVAGDADKLLPSVVEGEFMARQIPNAKLVIAPGLGHACLLSKSFTLRDVLEA